MLKPSRDPQVRLAIFAERGWIPEIPTRWQLLQGQAEMAPYVALPDEGDDERYRGAPLGHPLARTPIILVAVGPDHFRVGHGMHAKAESLFAHLNFVFHEGMPVFDLQLIHSIEGGLEALRSYTRAIEEGSDRASAQRRRWIDRVIPNASAYRQQLLERGGWIDRAAAFDYPEPDEVAEFLRPEFFSLVRFANYCASAFPRTWRAHELRSIPSHFYELLTRAKRGYRPAREETPGLHIA